MDLNETRDPEVYAMADELVGYLGEKGFVESTGGSRTAIRIGIPLSNF